MKVDYLDLRVRYEASGLTQKAFAKQEGLSANMLSYYLKKARAKDGSSISTSGISALSLTTISLKTKSDLLL